MNVKVFSKLGVLVVFAGLLVILAGCQPSEPQKADLSDLELMNQAETATRDPFYVLVVGNDSRVGTTEITKANYADGTGRSDTMMLVRVEPSANRVAIVTIPRDTATTYQGTTTKINEVYRQGGIEATMEQVEGLTGVAPKYYLDMGFVEFEQFVDDLGGLPAAVPLDMTLKDIVSGKSITLFQGLQSLDGSQALVLARVRKQYAADQDACRQIQDRQLVEVAIRKVAADPANAAAHAKTLLASAKTNWPAEDLAETVVDFVANANKLTIISGTGPYAGDVVESAEGLWLAKRDEVTWRKVIETVEKGGDPAKVVPLPEVQPAP